MQTRRIVLTAGVLGAAMWAGRRWLMEAPQAAEVFRVAYDDAEWRRRLTPEQYAVLRQAGTEMPFSSKLLHEGRPGIFTCAGCNHGLFSSATKFDSHTGWPSFWAPLDGAIGQTSDVSFGMVRNEVHCAECGGHLGHVFADGPKPTGLRYCMDGVALKFQPEAT